MIRTILAVVYLAFGIFLVLPWLILWSLATGSADFMYGVAMKVVRAAVRIAGVRVRVEGVGNIPPGVCIFAANHVSNMDPLAFVPAIPRRVAILVKKEVFRIPILGTAMRMAKLVPVDRENREAAAGSVDTAVKYLREGLSFAVYPEGTRSHDGRLLPFKKGTFLIAIRAGVPVVPVSIVGAQDLLRKGEWSVRPGEVSIHFGPAVDVSPYTEEQRADLMARVEELVAGGLPEGQKPVGSGSSDD
ncbi:MAG TPA: lysophospholipid acyltransferase family protein [Candidatus Acidoferrales bacterium]|jgi:1-acyl-sn-glycerol-3-phosphate acyltransferase|nr:lysophospholipid acyltransferase family protein [Candidatus Acidoferrales bacterium]